MFKWIFTRNNFVMLLYLALTSVMILARSSDFSQQVRYGGGTVLGGVQNALSVSVESIQQMSGDVVRLWRMNMHYKAMQKAIVEYSHYELEYHRLKLENERLRQELELPAQGGYKQVRAAVVARDGKNLSNHFVINKGYRSGLKPKMLVMAYNAQTNMYGVIGRVQEVFAFSARVVPITQNNAFLAAKVVPSGYEGLIVGGNWSGDEFILDYISRSALSRVAVGDTVVTSAVLQEGDTEASAVMSDLYIGEVLEILNDPTQVSLQLKIGSVMDLGRVSTVFVLVPEDQNALDWQLGANVQTPEQTRAYQEYYALQQGSGLAGE
jgi:rod shape-determining protein MreC